MLSLRCKDAFVKAPAMPSLRWKAASAPTSAPKTLRRCTRTDTQAAGGVAGESTWEGVETCAGRERVFARAEGAGRATHFEMKPPMVLARKSGIGRGVVNQ